MSFVHFFTLNCLLLLLLSFKISLYIYQRVVFHCICGLQISSLSVYMHAKPPQSCMNLCHAMDWSPPGSSVHGSLQARVLEWGAISSSRGSSRPEDQIGLTPPALAGRFFTTSTTWKTPSVCSFFFILFTRPF